MSGDRQLAERNKGRQETRCFCIDKLWDWGQTPDPLWASVSPFVNERLDWVISKESPKDGSEMGVKEVLLFFLTHF